ncbi:MAG: OB-fold domain-containing protein [Pseudonocardia sp.]|uniref:Zn-ribbon domain-containing OB-fold protein n=1 Tax=unclassified Pseudonocardia TaxID=2619320 RepID=UPI00086C2A6C|nr:MULTISPECIES: OB-fold domain-containing protein [unclassified Pseudonocardia]MBN9109404.1 OB-fold domain-containing protein [Pseudonocardia sp.]ODU29950.1 MAG: hypothetical protein ABS80_01060 [Pseudonocardia sp. SCN 72-51]ODV08113.1 MAG: hypothetical protein ABT15_05340 [Pseudonocardia sp. SCN 73-27]
MSDQQVPVLMDRDSREWWLALRRHELALQTCTDCGRLRWPSRAICNDCGSLEWRWTESRGTGTVVSWTVTHRPPSPQALVPYTVVLVRLDDQDDVFMPGGWNGPADGEGLAIGLHVRVGYQAVVDQHGEDATILRWEPSVGSGEEI